MVSQNSSGALKDPVSLLGKRRQLGNAFSAINQASSIHSSLRLTGPSSDAPSDGESEVGTSSEAADLLLDYMQVGLMSKGMCLS